MNRKEKQEQWEELKEITLKLKIKISVEDRKKLKKRLVELKEVLDIK